MRSLFVLAAGVLAIASGPQVQAATPGQQTTTVSATPQRAFLDTYSSPVTTSGSGPPSWPSMRLT